MKDIMIDIETFSTSHDAAIVSIGAVQFDMKTGQIGSKFYVNVDLQSCIDAGLTLSASTIMWWMQKNKEAQDSLLDSPIKLQLAMNSFADWLEYYDAMQCQIWANSPSFDCVILKNAFTACKMQLPWNYWNERDCRTLVALNPDIKRAIINDLPHDAISDCLYQIRYCNAIWNSISINK